MIRQGVLEVKKTNYGVCWDPSISHLCWFEFKNFSTNKRIKMNMPPSMPIRKERKKIPVKTVYTHIMRAKLYGVLTVNALEGIIHEIDEILPADTLDG